MVRFFAGFVRKITTKITPFRIVLNAVLVLSTEFQTDGPIRTKLAGEFDNSSILRWQVRLLLLQVRNDLVTALSTVIWIIFGPQMLSYYIKYF